MSSRIDAMLRFFCLSEPSMKSISSLSCCLRMRNPENLALVGIAAPSTDTRITWKAAIIAQHVKRGENRSLIRLHRVGILRLFDLLVSGSNFRDVEDSIIVEFDADEHLVLPSIERHGDGFLIVSQSVFNFPIKRSIVH